MSEKENSIIVIRKDIYNKIYVNYDKKKIWYVGIGTSTKSILKNGESFRNKILAMKYAKLLKTKNDYNIQVYYEQLEP